MQIGSKRFLARAGVRLIVTAAVLGPTVPVAAQGDPPPPPPPAYMMQRVCADQEALFAARMAFLEIKIAVRPEQRGEWEAFVAAMRAAEQPMRDLCASPPLPPKSDDPVALLEARDRMVTAHAAVLQATHTAAARLKERLAADQQRRLAEALLSPLGGPGPGLHLLGPPGMGLPGLPPPGFRAHRPPHH